MRAKVDGQKPSLTVYLDMLKKTVKQAHGIADRLHDLQSVLAEASLPANSFGSSDEAKGLAADWNAAVDQRISDLKKLRDTTASLGYKIKYVVESIEHTEETNSKTLSQVAGQIESEVEGVHKPGARPDPEPGTIVGGEKPGPGGMR